MSKRQHVLDLFALWRFAETQSEVCRVGLERFLEDAISVGFVPMIEMARKIQGMILDIIGHDKKDILEWFVFEHDFGARKSDTCYVEINGVGYTLTNPEDFYDVLVEFVPKEEQAVS